MAILHAITNTINTLCRPATLFTLAVILFFVVLYKLREQFAQKRTFILGELALGTFIAVSMLHPTFRAIVTKPDNVPIVGMLFLPLGFTWLSFNKMVTNDKLI